MTVAVRYAKATLGVAQQEAAQFNTFINAVATLAEAVVAPAILAGLRNPRLTPAQRLQLASSMAKAVQAPKALANLLGVLAQNRRLALLPEVLTALQEAIAANAGIVQATVHTAQPLTDTQKITLKVQIKAHQKAKDVRLTEVVQPELLGGFRAMFGGLVWDTSLRGKLNRLKTLLQQQA